MSSGDLALRGLDFPPPLQDGDDIDEFWLGFTRSLVRLSVTRKRSTCSAALARRGDRLLACAWDQVPPGVAPAAARQRDPAIWDAMHHSAEAALVAQASRHGICLAGAACYLWPMLTSAAGAALLISAGCTVLVEPDYPVPLARERDRQLVREMASEAGVRMVRTPISATFGTHFDSHGEHLD
jgi:hypothetical protein